MQQLFFWVDRSPEVRRAMFENLSLPHLLMVLAVAILIFGPKRIPEIAGSMGKGIREFKRHIGDATHGDSPEDQAISRESSNQSVADAPGESLRQHLPDSTHRGEPRRLL